MFKLDSKKYLNVHEIFFLLFPIAILLRSAALNIYIVLGAIFFISSILKNKKIFSLFPIKILSVFLIYLILISFDAENITQALQSSVSQLRFLFFTLFIAFLNIRKEKLPIIIFILSILVYFIIFDTLYQYYFKTNFIGITVDTINNPHRLSSFFLDELIVGSYITYFSIPIGAFFLSRIKNVTVTEKIYYISFIILAFISTLLSGERISLLIFISAFSILSLIYLNKIKQTVILGCIILSIIFSYNFNQSVKFRFNSFANDVVNFKTSGHGRLFTSAYIIWKQNYFTGTGLKNYRVTCANLKNENFADPFTNIEILCSTHPHNTYLEILVETGILGFILFLIFLISSCLFFIKSIKKISGQFKPFFWSALIIFASYLWPIKSSGSFISTYNGSYFWFFYGLILLCVIQSKNIKNLYYK